jgi:Arc/MetJ-type ribon-helix-helix transcriptional regulator
VDEQQTTDTSYELDVSFNGQQERVIRELVANDVYGRDAEAFIRDGLAAFAKRRRYQRIE